MAFAPSIAVRCRPLPRLAFGLALGLAGLSAPVPFLGTVPALAQQNQQWFVPPG